MSSHRDEKHPGSPLTHNLWINEQHDSDTALTLLPPSGHDGAVQAQSTTLLCFLVSFLFYLLTGVYILIAVGAVMMLVGFLGCYGAIQESQCLLGTVSLSLFDFAAPTAGFVS